MGPPTPGPDGARRPATADCYYQVQLHGPRRSARCVALATIRQIGGVMVKDGDITQAELDEMVALFDDPAFVDVRSVFISVGAQKPLA